MELRGCKAYPGAKHLALEGGPARGMPPGQFCSIKRNLVESGTVFIKLL